MRLDRGLTYVIFIKIKKEGKGGRPEIEKNVAIAQLVRLFVN